MEEFGKKEITDFKDFYNSLNCNEKAQLRNKIMECCELSLSTFYYKLTNESFKKLEIKQINSIISENKDLFR